MSYAVVEIKSNKDVFGAGQRKLCCGLHIITEVPVVNSGTCFISLSFPASQRACSVKLQWRGNAQRPSGRIYSPLFN